MTLRAKLVAIVGTAAVALVMLIVTGALTSQRVEAQLGKIQTLYLPRLELGAKLQGTLERLFKGFQDAAAARDPEALAATRALATSFDADLQSAKAAVNAGDAAALHTAMDDYYNEARAVTQRLISGETGEALVDSMQTMQAKQKRLAELTESTTSFERDALSRAFTDAEQEETIGRQIRLLTSVACLVLVFLLSWWLGRGVFASLTGLTSGFKRFANGEFTHTIRSTGRDELAEVAEHANGMAANLARLDRAREQSDWLKNGHATLVRELRGELEPQEAATRAAGCIARYLEAPAAALFAADSDRALQLLGSYSLAPAGDSARPTRFHPGEGLVGQAALQTEIMVVADPPADHLRVRSGLGESAPRALALLPLVHAGRVTGVLEVALFKPWSELYGEFFLSLQETLAIALEVARARAETRKLLGETQAQARRLAEQETELRATNEELEAQQEELRRSNEELVHRAAEMDAQQRLMEETNTQLDITVQRLAQKAEELSTVSTYKSQFLTNMSHELRTPLNSMLLLSHLLVENSGKNLTDKQVEFARTIHAAGQDLLALINQVLDLAKVEAGKQELRIERVAVSQLADRARRIFEPLARDKALAFRVVTATGTPTALTSDAQRVEQILTNLLGNAFKFTTRGEIVLHISAPRQGYAIAFAVSDTGPGIAPEHRARVFAPFEQIDAKSDRRYGGTGLGLGIARELATLLGGEIVLESTVGRGSTFTLCLPQEAPLSETTNAAAEMLATAKPAPNAGPINDDRASLQAAEPCLLVIEDDRTFADAFAEVIHAHGLKFLLAVDGESGVRLAKAHKPSGIILDVRLPDIDGFAVIERLRADPETADIPVHFASAADVAERSMASGAVGYLSKPAGHRDLVRVVESLVPKRRDTPRVLVVEDDTLTADSLIAQLAGEKIETQRAASAAQALKALQAERFGCMVLDLSLPDMDGLELLRLVQEQCGADMPSVVIYTARAMSKAEATRLEAYAEAIVIKDGQSGERLLNEIRLFVRRLKQGLGSRTTLVNELHPANLQLEGRKILVVDDDMRSVYALSAALRAKGVEVFVADTGRAALDSLAQHPEVEIVLMDMMMPEMDGYEAMRHIRENPRTAKLPIIALTAKAMKGDAEKCLAAGADDYLGKPIDVGRLLALVHRHLVADV